MGTGFKGSHQHPSVTRVGGNGSVVGKLQHEAGSRNGPAGEAGRPRLNTNTRVLVRASLSLLIGNRQEQLEDGVITDRSLTNQRERWAPVARLASRRK